MRNIPPPRSAVNHWPDHLGVISEKALFARQAGAHPRSIGAQVWRQLRGLEAAGGLPAVAGVKILSADVTLPHDLRVALDQVLALVTAGQVAS